MPYFVKCENIINNVISFCIYKKRVVYLNIEKKNNSVGYEGFVSDTIILIQMIGNAFLCERKIVF